MNFFGCTKQWCASVMLSGWQAVMQTIFYILKCNIDAQNHNYSAGLKNLRDLWGSNSLRHTLVQLQHHVQPGTIARQVPGPPGALWKHMRGEEEGKAGAHGWQATWQHVPGSHQAAVLLQPQLPWWLSSTPLLLLLLLWHGLSTQAGLHVASFWAAVMLLMIYSIFFYLSSPYSFVTLEAVLSQLSSLMPSLTDCQVVIFFPQIVSIFLRLAPLSHT